MKRGRRPKREIIQSNIYEALLTTSTQHTTSSLRRMVSDKLGQRVSWNTIQKYLDELVQANRVQMIVVPHCKIEGKDGLTMYQIKK
jgi:hypothetical protein